MHDVLIYAANLGIRLLIALGVALVPGILWAIILLNVLPPALTFTIVYVFAGIALEYTYSGRVI